MGYEADVASVEAIIAALYEVVSGPAGEKDWARERHLFHPQARLMRGSPPGEAPGLSVMSTEQFIATVAPRLRARDFHEYETGREQYRFGRWVQVVSAYASAERLGEPPFARGINAIQLWHDEGRWWIMSVLWDWETRDNPVPDELRG